jgi:hypothetical protein
MKKEKEATDAKAVLFKRLYRVKSDTLKDWLLPGKLYVKGHKSIICVIRCRPLPGGLADVPVFYYLNRMVLGKALRFSIFVYLC